MDRCEECDFRWTAPKLYSIDSIATCPALLAQLLIEFDDRTIRMRISPDVWSALEYTAHTGDAIGAT